jgi:hypothetical protein
VRFITVASVVALALLSLICFPSPSEARFKDCDQRKIDADDIRDGFKQYKVGTKYREVPIFQIPKEPSKVLGIVFCKFNSGDGIVMSSRCEPYMLGANKPLVYCHTRIAGRSEDFLVLRSAIDVGSPITPPSQGAETKPKPDGVVDSFKKADSGGNYLCHKIKEDIELYDKDRVKKPTDFQILLSQDTLIWLDTVNTVNPRRVRLVGNVVSDLYFADDPNSTAFEYQPDACGDPLPTDIPATAKARQTELCAELTSAKKAYKKTLDGVTDKNSFATNIGPLSLVWLKKSKEMLKNNTRQIKIKTQNFYVEDTTSPSSFKYAADRCQDEGTYMLPLTGSLERP